MNLSNSKIFLILCVSFILGVFIGKFINYQIMVVAAMIFVIVGTVFWSNKIILIFAIAGAVALLGSWRFMTDYRQNDLASFYNQKFSVEGVVLHEPDQRTDKTYLTLSKVKINEQELHSKVLLSVARFPQYEYGEKLLLDGKVIEPAEFEDFSYKNYLSRFGVDAVMYNPKIIKSEAGHGNVIKHAILNFKNKFTEGISQIMPEPQNAFLQGLLLGAKRSISQDLLDKFNQTGTSHIVALSGFNITIIAYGLDLALRRFRKRISFSLSLIAIVLFIIATGASASVIRAGIMGGLLLIALNIGRVYAITNALVFAAALMLIINPQILLFDVGFQLSFLALVGLVYLTPILNQIDLKLPKFIQTAFFATIAAQIFTLPILLVNFGQFSMVAPIVNILVLPAVPFAMFFGFFAGLVFFIHPYLAIPLSWICWTLLSYIIKVVEIFAAVPFAAVNLKFNWSVAAAYYLVLSCGLVVYYQKDKLISLMESWKPKPKTSSSI